MLVHRIATFLASRPQTRLRDLMFASLATLAACASPESNQAVNATYDKETGKLSQVTVDTAKDGKPNITSFMDGNKFLRIEIDQNEDGKVDRWEYYGPDQKLEKVGLSRSNDGKPDTWAIADDEGGLARVQVSTRADGSLNRTEFYRNNELLRAEVDTDGDGRTDRWETYADGALATLSLDLAKSGKPTTTIDYRK